MHLTLPFKQNAITTALTIHPTYNQVISPKRLESVQSSMAETMENNSCTGGFPGWDVPEKNPRVGVYSFGMTTYTVRDVDFVLGPAPSTPVLYRQCSQIIMFGTLQYTWVTDVVIVLNTSPLTTSSQAKRFFKGVKIWKERDAFHSPLCEQSSMLMEVVILTYGTFEFMSNHKTPKKCKHTR